MAQSTAHKAARAKAAKEKKLLIFLTVPLLLAGFYAYHTLHKSNQSPSSAPPAATTAPTSTTSAAPSSQASPPAPAAPAPDGKLTSLALLPSRDPFGGGVGQPSSTASSPATTTTPAVSSTPKQTKPVHKKSSQPVKTKHKAASQPVKQQKPQRKKLGPPPADAVLALDGMLIQIHLHKTFGEVPGLDGEPPQPLFWVVTLTHETAKIVVVGKQRAYTLKVDAPMALSDLDGDPHTLMLLPQGTPLPSAPGATASATTSTGKSGR
jgi:hypothetical protein